MAKSVLIAGGGIGGLCAWLALRRVGLDAVVLEQAHALGEVGAGIQLSANAMKALNWMDVGPNVASKAVRPEAMIGFDGISGTELYRRELGDAYLHRYGESYLHIHRADFLSALFESVNAESLELGFRVESVEASPDGVCVTAEDGRSREGALLIGADGLRSKVRQALGLKDAPFYTGMTAYRGTIPTSRLPEDLVPRASSNWMGPHGHVIVYYLRNYELVNVVAVSEVEDWTTESWSLEVSTPAMLERFSGWHPTVLRLISEIEHPFQWGLYGRSPETKWGDGPIALLGDAAHPMVPFLAQGAAMAIEDAVVLAHCLNQPEGMSASGLRRYEDLRRDRTARVQLAALDRSNELHETDSTRIAARNRGYARRQNSAAARFRDFDWIYRYDPVAAAGSTTKQSA